jgi:hypothetical protein
VITVAFALLGAAAYGVSDFLGGIVGRRASSWAVAATGGLGGAVASAVVALLTPGHPGAGDLAWGAAAGRDRDAEGAAHLEGRQDLVAVAGSHDRPRLDPVERGVAGVRRQRGPTQQHVPHPGGTQRPRDLGHSHHRRPPDEHRTTRPDHPIVPGDRGAVAL